MAVSETTSRRPWSRVAPIAILCVCALLLLWRPVLRGEVFLPVDALLHIQPWRYSYERVPVNNPRNTDPIRQTYPRRLLTNTIIKQGAWPLWNPTILTGTPLLDDGQLAFFYPPTLLFLIIPLNYALGYYTFLQVILAAVGAYLFARQLRLSQLAATIAGACYMFNGYFLTWLQFPHHSAATAMLPWCFWAVDRACTHARARDWALAGFVLAMPILTQIQLAFYIYVAVGCWLLMRMAGAQTWPARLRMAAWFSAAVLIALALSAVQLAPALALSAEGQRSELSSGIGTADNQFISMMRLFLPTINGTPRVGPPRWGPELLQLPQPYVGVIGLLLAGLALLISRHRASLFFGVMAVAAFALAISSPLLQLLMIVLPPYRQFEDHTRWFLLWGFGVAILAGMAVQTVQVGRQKEPTRSRVLVANRIFLGLLLLFLVGWSLQQVQLFTPDSKYGEYITLIRQQAWQLPLLIIAAGAAALALVRVPRVPALLAGLPLVAVLVADLLWYGGGFNTSVDLSIIKPTKDVTAALAAYPPEVQQSDILYPPTRQVAYLQSQPKPFRILGATYDVFPPNVAGTFGLEDIRGYHSLYTARYNRLARLMDGKDYTRTGEGSINLRPYFTSSYTHRRLLDMLNVEYIIFPPDATNMQQYGPLELVQQNDEGSIYRNTTVLPRAWLVHQATVITSEDAELDQLARADFDPGTLGIVPAQLPALAQPSAPEPQPTVSYAPNQLTVQAQPSAPALLVVSDAYAPDWHVTVDGQAATLYRTNYTLRGVWLPAGEHTVVFSYQPRAFFIGGAISLVTLLALLGVGVWVILIATKTRRRKGVENNSHLRVFESLWLTKALYSSTIE